MKREKPKPDPDANGPHASLWRMLEHQYEEFQDFRAETRRWQAGIFVGVALLVIKAMLF